MGTRQLLRADGCRLHVETHGDRSRPAIVLLEGSGGDLPGWSRTIANLERELFVVAYDHRGNGWSDAPDEPQTMTTFVEDAASVLDDLQVERAHVYGQSFGGMVAIGFALAHSERVQTLILAATHAGGDAVVARSQAVPKGEADTAIFAADYVRDHPEGVRGLSEHGVPQQRHAGRRQWEAMRAYDVSGRLGELRMPVLVLHGDGDRIIDVGNASYLAEHIPGAELVVLEGAGHVYHWEQPEASDGAILDFIRRHP